MSYFIGEEAQFDEIIKKNDKVYCIFSATWCPPCKSLKAKLDEVLKQVSNVAVYIFDVDHCQNLANRLRIRGIPHSMLYVKGELNKTHSGDFATPQQLSDWLSDKNFYESSRSNG